MKRLVERLTAPILALLAKEDDELGIAEDIRRSPGRDGSIFDITFH
jgi:hypothetical protein